jgi:hypothetical protein
MPLLGLLWGATGFTSLGRYLMIGIAALFAMGFVVSGITAPYKRDIKRLETTNKDLILASEQKDAQLAAHELRVEEDRKTQELFDVEIKGWLASRSAACRVTDAELRKLVAAAAR